MIEVSNLTIVKSTALFATVAWVFYGLTNIFSIGRTWIIIVLMTLLGTWVRYMQISGDYGKQMVSSLVILPLLVPLSLILPQDGQDAALTAFIFAIFAGSVVGTIIGSIWQK